MHELAESVWVFSDFRTFAVGSTTRLSRLRSHVQEVSDKISAGNFSEEGKAHDFGNVESYLREVSALLEREEQIQAASKRPFFRGRAR